MKRILTVLLIVFIFIQFFQIDKTNPAPTPQLDFLKIKQTPEPLSQYIRDGCYNCHSNETRYYWYSNVQPLGWFLKNHIDQGRKELNFSTFATYEPKRQAHKLDEAAEMLEKGEMPLQSYTIAHSEAQFTPAQKAELIKYFKMTAEDIRRTHNLSKP